MQTVGQPQPTMSAPESTSPRANADVETNIVRLKSHSIDTDKLNRDGQAEWARRMQDLALTTSTEVAVLLFAWEVEAGFAMDTSKELKDLKEVFESKYNFKVETKLLKVSTQPRPRNQLTTILNDFVAKHDRSGTTLVVYYGGHGRCSDNEGELVLSAGNLTEQDPLSKELIWNRVESVLYDISSNLLLIFDCCHAGVITRGERRWPASTSHFEFVASTAHDKKALGPKSPGSFTRAMIDALHVLVEEDGFTPRTLLRKIFHDPQFHKRGRGPFVHECGKSNPARELKIIPRRRRSEADPAQASSSGETVNFYLHLKYVFKETPSQEHYRVLAERLDELVKSDRLPVADVLWEGLSEYNPRMSVADAARMMQARLGRHCFKKPAGRLEISASTQKPPALIQRTLTTLTMDQGVLIPASDEAEPKIDLVNSADRHVDFFHHFATVPVFFRPIPVFRSGKTGVCLAILALSAAITFSRVSHSFWTWPIMWAS